MPGPNPLEFDIATQIGSSIDDEGFEDVHQNAEGEDDAGAAPLERHHFYGLWGRALDPELDQSPAGQPATGQPNPAKGAQLLLAYEGDKGHAWTMEDPRAVAIVPVPEAGCSVFYGINATAGKDGASLGCCYVRTRADGSIVQATTTTNGGVDGITTMSTTEPSGFTRIGPYGQERFGRFAGEPGGPALFTGYALSVIGGGRFTIGYIGGLPGPASGFSAHMSLNAAVVRIVAPAVRIGAKGKPADSVAKLKPALAMMQAIVQLQTAIIADLSTATGAGVTAKALLPNVQTLLQGLQTAMATDTQVV